MSLKEKYDNFLKDLGKVICSTEGDPLLTSFLDSVIDDFYREFKKIERFVDVELDSDTSSIADTEYPENEDLDTDIFERILDEQKHVLKIIQGDRNLSIKRKENLILVHSG